MPADNRLEPIVEVDVNKADATAFFAEFQARGGSLISLSAIGA